MLGALWASFNENRDKVRIIELQEEIATLSNEALNQITGGDSWCYIGGGLRASGGGIWSGQPILLSFIFEGTIPMYDVSVKIYNTVPYGLSRELFFEKEIGTLTNTKLSYQLGMFTIPDNDRVDYLVEINSRNGQIIQHLIYIKKDEKVWLTGTKVLRWKAIENHTYRYENLYEFVDSGFPKDSKFIKS